MKQSKHILTLLLAGWLAGIVPAIASAELNLIPWPAQVTPGDGTFALTEQTAVVADSAFAREAAALAVDLHLTNTVATSQKRIELTTRGAEGLAEEAYQLEVRPAGVTIRAISSAGAFYGCQTLKQLLDASARTIPAVQIADAPRYAWRGFLLDVSRHFFDQAAIQREIDWLAGYKLNRLHLHLTDDPAWRLEIQKYPQLTRTGARGNFSDSNAPAAYFTRAAMRQIIAYAQAQHIVVVPEIDMPGHASAATRTFPELDGGVHTFNPGRELTYDFLENVLLEVMDTFPSPWIHLGGDEVDCTVWNTDPAVAQKLQADGLKSPQQLEQSFVRRMAGFIHDHGRTPVGWDEVAAAKPVKNTLIFWWRHDRPDVLAAALAGGYDVVLSPRAPCYLDYPQDLTYPVKGRKLFNTLNAVYRGPEIPATITAAARQHILGVEGCVWTERIATTSYLEFMTMPRLAALAEMAWTPEAARDFTRFDACLKPFLQQYRAAGIHYYDETDPAGSLHEAIQAAPPSARLEKTSRPAAGVVHN